MARSLSDDDAFPNEPGIAPVSISIFASWGLWTLVFLLVTTGFYWMYFGRKGNTRRNVFVAAIWATLATLGLAWLGMVNMGLVPLSILIAAMVWGAAEQCVSATIVARVMHNR